MGSECQTKHSVVAEILKVRDRIFLSERRNCTWKTIAESKLPTLQPRMMATSRMDTLAVREDEDVVSAREE